MSRDIIALGFGSDDKAKCVREAKSSLENNTGSPVRVFHIVGRSRLELNVEDGNRITYADAIEYKHFYPWLREIDGQAVLVIDECLRTRQRSALHYNCIRHYVAQAGRVVVFQYFPIIEALDDFATLFDFATKSRWRRDPFSPTRLDEVDLRIKKREIHISPLVVPTSAKEQAALERKKRALIDSIGLRDPHTIPRNLYLETGRARRSAVDSNVLYVGRNNRFKLSNLSTYRNLTDVRARSVFEFPHDHIVFADFLAQTQQREVRALVADTKVDRWYLDRHVEWTRRLADAYATLR